MALSDESHDERGGLSHLVCSCIHCNEVIGLPEDYATGDSLVCPVCEKPLAPEEVKARTLRVAFHSDAIQESEPPARPAAELPTSDSLKEWLERSSAELGFADSVLEPTPSEHTRDDDTEVESSLSGVELGKLFPEGQLAESKETETSLDLPSESEPSDLAEPEAASEEPTQKKTLSETLGWGEPSDESEENTSGFRSFASQVESQSKPEPIREEPAPEPAPAVDENATVTFEPSTASKVLEGFSPEQAPTPFEPEQFPAALMEHAESAEEDEQEESNLFVEKEDSGQQNRMFWPAVAAVLIGVGAPVGYFAYTSISDGTPAAESGAVASDTEEPAPWPTPEAPDEDLPEVETPTGIEQASFEQTLPPHQAEEDQATEEPVVYGDRYGNSNAPVVNPFDAMLQNEPPAEATAELEQEVAPVALLGAPSYGIEELSEALTLADKSGQAFAAGSLDDPTQVQEVSRHYARLCYLAQVVTLLEVTKGSHELLMAELDAMDRFHQAWNTVDSQERSSQVAGPWLEWTGRPHGGVFFIGAPKLEGESGGVYEYHCDLAGAEVSILSPKPLDVATLQQPIGLVGVVVEDPQVHLPSYQGMANRAVWVRKIVPLASPSAP